MAPGDSVADTTQLRPLLDAGAMREESLQAEAPAAPETATP